MSKNIDKEDLFNTASILLYVAVLVLGIVSGFIYGSFFN